MDEHQRINHFRNHYELTRKDLMDKNLKRMRKQLERTDSLSEAAKYNFFPSTFVLPSEYGLFLEEFKRNPHTTWIMKPIGRAQGKGIFLFTKLGQIADWRKDHKWKADGPQAETYIVQRYIHDPYTIGGKKFDLRLYVLVTSYTPLVVWMFRQGFARVSNTRYGGSNVDHDNLFMHLTNASIQKQSEDYDKAQGCKLDLKSLKLFMIARHGKQAVNAMFYEMQALITRSLLSVQKVIIQDKHSFELYGYDVMIDSHLKPWLIEVNASPSLSADTDGDYQLKYGIVEDTLDVVDIEGKLTGDEKKVGGYDLIWNNGPVKGDRGYFTTHLGCDVDRDKPIPPRRRSRAR
jgi:tubulin polyglutamylase TTLL9